MKRKAWNVHGYVGVVSQADYTDHLVFAPGTLGQCKARQLRQRKHGDYVYLLF